MFIFSGEKEKEKNVFPEVDVKYTCFVNKMLY